MSIPHISTETYHRSSRPRRPYEVSESPRLQLRPLWDAAPLPVLWSQMAPVGSWRPPLATRRMLDDVGWCGMMWDDVGWVFFMDFEWLLILCWYCWHCWGRNGSPYPDTPKASTSFAKCQGALVPCEGRSLKTCLAPPHSWPWAGAGILDGDLKTAQDPGPTENQGRGQGRGQHVQSTSGVTATFQLSNCHSQVELPCALRKAPTFAMTSNKAWTAGKTLLRLCREKLDINDQIKRPQLTKTNQCFPWISGAHTAHMYIMYWTGSES